MELEGLASGEPEGAIAILCRKRENKGGEGGKGE